MKKLTLLLIIMMFLVTGCISSELNKEKKMYDSFIKELKEAKDNQFDKDKYFDINVYFEKLDPSEVTYRVIIDKPTKPIKQIQAIVLHNLKTNDIYPTSGLFEEPLNLIPNVIDKDHNNVKGIILVGYIPYTKDLESFKITVSVLVKYIDQDNKRQEVFYKYQK